MASRVSAPLRPQPALGFRRRVRKPVSRAAALPREPRPARAPHVLTMSTRRVARKWWNGRADTGEDSRGGVRAFFSRHRQARPWPGRLDAW